MKTLAYSMSGDGRGHATRVIALVEGLKNSCRVILYAPGKAYALLTAEFEGRDHVEVRHLPGMFFRYSGRRVSYTKTYLGNLPYVLRVERLVHRLANEIQFEGVDLVITDFDAALPRAAELVGIPYLSIDHQHFMTHCKLDSLPRRLRIKAQFLGHFINKYYRQQRATVVSSFCPLPARQDRGNAYSSGVMLRKELLNANPVNEGHLLVYSRHLECRSMMEALRQSDRPVLVYGMGERQAEGPIRFRKVCPASFQEDLIHCHALVTSAGNQLVGEAIFLGKAVLAIPEPGDFEQEINAHLLQRSGAGEQVRFGSLTGARLRRFSQDAESFQLSFAREKIVGNHVASSLIHSFLGYSSRSEFTHAHAFATGPREARTVTAP